MRNCVDAVEKIAAIMDHSKWSLRVFGIFSVKPYFMIL